MRHVFRFWLFACFHGWSVEKAYRRLRDDPDWEHAVPSPATVSRRMATPAFDRYMQRFFRTLCRVAVSFRVSDLWVLAIDSTVIEASRDPHARWGHTGDGPFLGYKLHLLVNRKGVPLAAWVSQGHRSDHEGVARLLDGARQVLATDTLRDRVRLVVADAGYDAEAHYATAFETIGASFLAPENRRNRKTDEPSEGVRSDAFRLLKTKRGKRIMARRSEIERVNSQLKDSSSINMERLPRHVRGKVKVRRYILAKVIQYTLGIIDNRFVGRKTRTMAYAA